MREMEHTAKPEPPHATYTLVWGSHLSTYLRPFDCARLASVPIHLHAVKQKQAYLKSKGELAQGHPVAIGRPVLDCLTGKESPVDVGQRHYHSSKWRTSTTAAIRFEGRLRHEANQLAAPHHPTPHAKRTLVFASGWSLITRW